MTKVKSMHLYGYGQIREIKLNEEFFRCQETEESGKLLAIYPLTRGMGGYFLSKGVSGYLGKYKQVFLVVAADEEYVYAMLFQKNNLLE